MTDKIDQGPLTFKKDGLECEEVILHPVNIDGNFGGMDKFCTSEGCAKERVLVHLTLKSDDTRSYPGYMDPEKGFKEPKMFKRRVVQWRGKCERCGAEYEASLRVNEVG